MKFFNFRKGKKGRKGKKEVVEETKKVVLIRELKPDYKIVETYWVHDPFAKVNIVTSPEFSGYQYFVEETKLTEEEKKAQDRLIAILGKELEPPESIDFNASSYVLSEAKRIVTKYRRSLEKFTPESWGKIFYYVVRNLAGYGELNALLIDPNIEDISCNGLYKPIYIWHQKYQSIPTNIEFIDERFYDNFLLKFAHLSEKHVSSANPMLDAMLPEGHRLAATFMKEVSPLGSSFCIRKFRSNPFSIIDLIKLGTLDAEIAAYLWILLENKMNIMVIGGTGAGKTSMLNALTGLIPPNDKIITVEEIAELNPPHENWVQLVSRRGFQFGYSTTTAISLFDLVKLSLRYRPDYLIVGEIRGEEAYVLFQAVATGHGGLCTMHADSLDHAAKRLTSPPMNVAEVYIPLMNVGIYVAQTELPKKGVGDVYAVGRRVRGIWEIVDYGKYTHLSWWSTTNDVFKSKLDKSHLLDQIAEKRGLEKKDLLKEIEKRKSLIQEMLKNNIVDYGEVANTIMKYYASQGEISIVQKKSEERRQRILEKTQNPEEKKEQVVVRYK